MKRKKVLVVDDDLDFLFVMNNRLVLAGYDVVSADNGVSAFYLATLSHPDLILLDLEIAGVSGRETAHCLKTDQRTQDVPVLFSSLILHQELTRMRDHGNPFRSKALHTQKLICAIDEVLAQSRRRTNPLQVA